VTAGACDAYRKFPFIFIFSISAFIYEFVEEVEILRVINLISDSCIFDFYLFIIDKNTLSLMSMIDRCRAISLISSTLALSILLVALTYFHNYKFYKGRKSRKVKYYISKDPNNVETSILGITIICTIFFLSMFPVNLSVVGSVKGYRDFFCFSLMIAAAWAQVISGFMQLKYE